MSQYYYDTDYLYNVFGADEHLSVRLWRTTKKGYVKVVASWEWSTFFSRRFAWSRAEARIRRLRETYGAEPL